MKPIMSPSPDEKGGLGVVVFLGGRVYSWKRGNMSGQPDILWKGDPKPRGYYREYLSHIHAS